MAACVRTLAKHRCLLYNISFTTDCLQFMPRSLVCHQQIRGRKRSSQPPSWFAIKKGHPRDRFLTKENREFLDEAYIAQYPNLSSPLKNEPWPRNPWTPETRRTGMLGIKLGKLPQWTKDGKMIFTTLIQVIDNHVVRYTPPEKYELTAGFKPWWNKMWPKKIGSVVVGALSCEPWKYSKAYNNLFIESGVPTKRKLTRFLVTEDAAIQPGTPLNVLHFQVGKYVDVSAKTIEHGFQGVMKRWDFKGGPASHGATKFHRKPGGIGGGGNKHGLWKGKKLPGHMGNDWQIGRGLKIIRINTKYNVIYVRGTNVPGPTHAYVRIYDSAYSKYRTLEGHSNPMPTFYPEDATEEIQEEYFDDELFQFTDDSIRFQEEQ